MDTGFRRYDKERFLRSLPLRLRSGLKACSVEMTVAWESEFLMFSIWKVFLAQDDESGWRRFLPFLILMILYGLSSFFKNKPKKPPVRPQPKPGPSQQKTSDQTRPGQRSPTTARPPTRLPSYARKRTATVEKPQPSHPSRPVSTRQPRTSPTLAKPVPMSRPVERPSGEMLEPPRPKPRAHRPAATQAEASEPVRRTTAPSSVKPTTQTSRHIQTEKKPRTTGQHPKSPRTSTSSKTAVRALHSRHEHASKSKSKSVAVKFLTATERLVKSTSRKGALAQAILYGEILGTPMSLRPMGSHSYAAPGLPGNSR